MHKQAQQLEAARVASETDGGIRQAFSSSVTLFVCLIEGIKLSPPLCEKILARTLYSDTFKGMVHQGSVTISR